MQWAPWDAAGAGVMGPCDSFREACQGVVCSRITSPYSHLLLPLAAALPAVLEGFFTWLSGCVTTLHCRVGWQWAPSAAAGAVEAVLCACFCMSCTGVCLLEGTLEDWVTAPYCCWCPWRHRQLPFSGGVGCRCTQGMPASTPSTGHAAGCGLPVHQQ